MKCPRCGSEANGNFCEDCGYKMPHEKNSVRVSASYETNTVKASKKQGILLGFRSNKGYKKFLSVLYLIFCGLMFVTNCMGGREAQVTTQDYLIDKAANLVMMLTFLSPYIFLSNTKLRKVLPLFNKEKAILSAVGLVISTFVLGILSGAIQSMHSAEYQADMENHAYVVVSSEGVGCTTDGIASMKCEYCGSATEEPIAASGHNYVEQSRVEPNCTDDGNIAFKCANCNEISIEPISAQGHDLTVYSQVDATCSAPGQVVGSCNVCGEDVTEEIPQLTHMLVEISRQNATDYEDGEVISRCDHCGEETAEVIPCLIPRGSKENPYLFEPQILFDLSIDGLGQKPYFEQWINVTGTVLSISDHGDLKGYYLVGSAGNGVVCWVDGDSTKIEHGQSVNFIGKVSVADTKHIEINECEIISVTWPEEKLKSPVTISNWRYTIDYLGGVEWNFKLTNNTDKEIKYVVMEWNCYNGVGDPIRCDLTGKYSHSIKYTGPLGSGQTTDTLRNTSLFYNHSYKSAKLSKLQVEFMDGTIINVNGQAYTDYIANY